MTDPGNELPECLACGTCCFSNLDRYVRVTGDDYERLGDAAELVAHFIGNRAYMRMDAGRCCALILDRASSSFACRVYERRPQVCRDLERGSPQCLAERHEKGERPLRALKQRP